MTTPSHSWQPIVPSHSVQAADNVVAGFTHGEELVLWRTAEGSIQAWDNRCPHRGMRLTLGRIVDNRLSCAYHGWEYEAGGQCTGIPAQPRTAAPRYVCVKTYRAAEARGMVWVAPGDTSAASPPLADGTTDFFCRTLGVRASGAGAGEVLAAQGFIQTVPFTWEGTVAGYRTTLYVTHAREQLTFIHTWLDSAAQAASLKPAMAALRRLRLSIESAH